MVNITQKSNTLRIAVAVATLHVSTINTMQAIEQRKVPKGDVFEFARAAGLLAIKKTSDVIPDCHPLPVEFASITYSMKELSIQIRVEVHTIYKTGVEVEAMHGASVTALTMYDMLKPIDKGIEISNIKLESKSGGKSDFKKGDYSTIKAGVIVCSDTVAKGDAIDTAGKAAIEKLNGFGIETVLYEVITDDFDGIQATAKKASEQKINLLLFTGGTGVSLRDNTPEAIEPLLTKTVQGVMETARRYGQDRMPFSMLSRGVSGFINETFVITMPGSEKGVRETIDAIFPQLLHVFKVKKGERH